MARMVKVSALAPRPHVMNPHKDMNVCVDEMISFWDENLKQVLYDRPDLIVLPEACDRPPHFTKEQLDAYYAARGERILDHFKEIAKTYQCNIAYSAARILPDGTRRNSTQFINRRGEIDGIYNKNHLTHGEYYESHILYGKDAPIIETDFGKVAGAICFDLNFKELLEKYERLKPELIVFSSMYHGGLMQNYWAYACRSYFIGCVSDDQCTVINPMGDLVAQSTNYFSYLVTDINLDYAVVHIDYNREKFQSIKEKYGSKVKIYDPGHVGSVLMTSETDDFSIHDVISEFEIETWDEYYARSLSERHMPGHIEP